MGDVGCNFSWMFVGNFLMIFYTDVFGIGMSAVATLMLVARIWDAVNDPLIGALSDKTKSPDRCLVRQDQVPLGQVPSLAVVWCPFYGFGTDAHLLGPSRVVTDSQDYLYGRHLLHPGYRLYLRQLAIRNAVRSHDAGY